MHDQAEAVNCELKVICEKNGLYPILHDDIDKMKHLNGRKLHLSKVGPDTFATNYIKHTKAL